MQIPQNFQKKQSFSDYRPQGLVSGLAWRLASSAENFLEFLGIRMVLAPYMTDLMITHYIKLADEMEQSTADLKAKFNNQYNRMLFGILVAQVRNGKRRSIEDAIRALGDGDYELKKAAPTLHAEHMSLYLVQGSRAYQSVNYFQVRGMQLLLP